MNDSVKQAISALRKISRNEDIKEYLLQNPVLYSIVLKSAMRFIGGETLDECFRTVEKNSQLGHAYTFDFMGESTRDELMANQVTEEFIRVIEKIKATSANASISLDLSHIGLVIDKKTCLRNALTLAKKAKNANIEMMISMEGIDRIDDILDIYMKISENYSNVGITLQAYLYRTEQDLENILKLPGKIRLVKGAFEASKDVALPWGEETDSAYKKYLTKILEINHLVSIATHDEDLLKFAYSFIKSNLVDKDNVEFEMLHGAKPHLLLEMHHKGYKTRDYLPYGKEWYLYLCHRLAENPENIYQALADAVS